VVAEGRYYIQTRKEKDADRPKAWVKDALCSRVRRRCGRIGIWWLHRPPSRAHHEGGHTHYGIISGPGKAITASASTILCFVAAGQERLKNVGIDKGRVRQARPAKTLPTTFGMGSTWN